MEFAILGVLLCNLLLFAFALIRLKSSISTLKRTLVLYFQPQGENPSEFAAAVELISKILAKNIVDSAKAYLLSLNSAEVRAGKAALRDSLSSQSPLLAGLLQAFPSLGKKIVKNPEMAQIAMNFLNRRSGESEEPGSNGHETVAISNPFKI